MHFCCERDPLHPNLQIQFRLKKKTIVNILSPLTADKTDEFCKGYKSESLFIKPCKLIAVSVAKIMTFSMHLVTAEGMVSSRQLSQFFLSLFFVTFQTFIHAGKVFSSESQTNLKALKQTFPIRTTHCQANYNTRGCSFVCKNTFNQSYLMTSAKYFVSLR